MSERILVSETIQTVYELAVKNPSRVGHILEPVINELLES